MHITLLGAIGIAFAAVYLLTIIYQGLGRDGRGISEHPYGHAYADTPGAARGGSLSKDELVSSSVYARGTR